jgi:hypothetical protein
MPRKRPFSVTIILVMVLIHTAWGAARLLATLRSWRVLNEFESGLGAWYLAVTGAGWSIAGGVLLSGILRRRKWAPVVFVLFASISLFEYWLERIFFETSRSNLPFAAACSVLIAAAVWILTNLPGTQSYFAKSEEHEQPDEKSNSARETG